MINLTYPTQTFQKFLYYKRVSIKGSDALCTDNQALVIPIYL